MSQIPFQTWLSLLYVRTKGACWANRPSELESQLGVVLRLAPVAEIEVPRHTFLYASMISQERNARGEKEGLDIADDSDGCVYFQWSLAEE